MNDPVLAPSPSHSNSFIPFHCGTSHHIAVRYIIIMMTIGKHMIAVLYYIRRNFILDNNIRMYMYIGEITKKDR